MNADVTVREVVDREYVGVSESDSLLESVELLLEEGADSALVLRGSEPVGILTERDVLRVIAAGREPAEATAKDAMSPIVPTIDPDESLPTAIDRVSAESTRHLIVESDDEEEPLGLLTEHDLLTSTTYDAGASSRRGPAQPVSHRESPGGEAETVAREAFEDQGICEVCGSLSRNLAAFNGQLRCRDCRSMGG